MGPANQSQSLATPLPQIIPFSGWLNTLTALGVVIGLIYLLRAVLTRTGRGGISPNGSALVEVLARVGVTPRNHILMLRTGQRILVLSESSAGLQTLANLDDPQEVASLLAAVTANKPNSISAGFSHLLGRFNRQYDVALDDAEASTGTGASDGGSSGGGYGIDHARDQLSRVLSRIRATRYGGTTV